MRQCWVIKAKKEANAGAIRMYYYKESLYTNRMNGLSSSGWKLMSLLAFLLESFRAPYIRCLTILYKASDNE